MSKTSRTLITMPKTARKGEIIEIKAIVQHDMETGFRHTEQGKLIPRDIIRVFTCQFNGAEIFKADFFPAVGANPLLIFTVIATTSGTLQFSWAGDDGYLATNQSQITVT